MKLTSLLSYFVKAILLGAAVAGLLLLAFPKLRYQSGDYGSEILNSPPISYAAAVRLAGPAVVNIYTRSFQRSLRDGNDTELRPKSLGSGVIMTAKGQILTNYHVIADADQIIVALQDGRILTADLVGVDVPTDLAVLSISADNLPVIPQDQKRTPEVGDVVLAIGNPYNVGQTITQGIISATGRNGLSSMGPDSNGRQDLLQTDAAINSGNSGGALVNTRGELVGINTAAYHLSSNQESYGISFAIPYRLARRIMTELIANGRVSRGYVGVSTVEVDPVTARLLNLGDLSGLVVENLDPNGPGAKAGLARGDVLLMIDDQPLQGVRSVMDRIAESKPGQVVRFTVLREGKRQEIPVTIEEDLRFQHLRQKGSEGESPASAAEKS
ncbi:outer membrane-stress sensor serine endopeptidase DegS [Pseudaeromonas paramecii]|uniref:Outer membrane-stress sensor serine endopeptidase DegS n=1 Tax=Pseudaeromonas paramecii TaxID=2138166 RepID=A0ABP8Q708_9GAMM